MRTRLVPNGRLLNADPELVIGRVHPQVGLGRVGSGRIVGVSVGHPG